MKTFRKKVKSVFAGKDKSDERCILSYLISDLIHTTNRHDALIKFEKFVKIFGFKKETVDFAVLIKKIVNCKIRKSGG